MISDVPKCIADKKKKNLKVAMLVHKGTLIEAKGEKIMVIICRNVNACI